MLALYFVYQEKTYHRQRMLAASAEMTGGIQEKYQNIKSYMRLGEVNDSLANELARMKNRYYRSTLSGNEREAVVDTVDSLIYHFIPARVIRSDYTSFNNYLILDKGKKDSVEPGMGVTSIYGVVGIISESSPHYSKVMSLLHHDIRISAKLAKNGQSATLKWNGTSPLRAELLYLTYPSPIAVGDTVVTAGASTYFPEGEMLGVIEEFELNPGADFYKVKVRLSTPFDRLQYVFIIENKRREELKMLEENP